ncbi:MAG TPA: ORF6N domain-containing protein [Pseudobacter sp.]|jgi:hypothetical protein|nr:ORF6N domain-containing protein [Pseudobacter sp.]
MQKFESIQNRIYTIREERVMLDYDLAVLYEVETKVLNQAVKRNILRFPEDFMFRLTAEEWEVLKSQVSHEPISQFDMRSQFVTSSGPVKNSPSLVISVDTTRNRPVKNLPFAFTEHGIAMLSGVLHSEKAIKMNIAIMRTFIAVKKLSAQQLDLLKQIQAMENKLGNHDVQLSELYQAMENLIDENIARKKWENRPRIGFKP